MTARLDERQLAIRSRCTTLGLGLGMLAVLANGWAVDTFGAWGTGLDQAMLVVMTAMAVVTVPAIWQGAYAARGPGLVLLLCLTAAAALMNLAVVTKDIAIGRAAWVWAHGHAGQHFTASVIGAYCAVVAATLALRLLLDRREERQEEQEPEA